MKRAYPVIPLMAMLIGLPLAGIWLAGLDVQTYLEMPPRTQRVEHAAFSWPVFIGLAIVILAVMLPFIVRVIRAGGADAVCPGGAASAPPRKHTLPWWGWPSIILGALFWWLAWTRQPWFETFQMHTFTPLWLCYIAVVNALTRRRTGRCMLTHETAYFGKLFVLSAAFWWFFEYLNRFVQNWWYTAGSEFSAWQYLVSTTFPFATVLPAVLSTEQWLATYPAVSAGLQLNKPTRVPHPKAMAWATLLLSGTGLFLIGWFPDLLFPLLWVAPLLLLIALAALQGRPSFFPEVRSGDLRRIFRFALAALICGLFWEMWNLKSDAKWIYTIPYVGRFRLFEMPILGYAGYLPFGLECAAIAQLIRRT